MDWNRYRQVLAELHYGKRLPAAIYLHRDSEACRTGTLADVVCDLSTQYSIDAEFNVVKFRTDAPRLSFLSYPTFEIDAHPALAQSVAIDLETKRTYRTSYEDNLNPPILHRKELLLSPEDMRIAGYAALSVEEETAGLYDNTSIIGFRLNWERLLGARGLAIEDHHLILLDQAQVGASAWPSVPVFRHRTALTRRTLSKPVRTLVEHDQLQPGSTFFDYGCGLGADVRGIRELGFEATGWDPVHAPQVERCKADVVNLGYVLNVIEDPAERLETLLEAWSLTRRLLVVSALVGDSGQAAAISFGDGVITKRQTFQKYFTQNELQHYVEDALEAAAVPVSLGTVYVFRSETQHQTFLQSRSRRIVDWSSLSVRPVMKARSTKVPRAAARAPRPDKYDQNRDLLENFWAAVVQCGRAPLPAEFAEHNELRNVFNSERRALHLLLARDRQQLFETAQATKRKDLLVYLASANLRRHIRLRDLSNGTREDIRTFFGSYKRGLEEGLALLRSAADPNTVILACDDTTDGWQDERSLYISTALVERLSIVLRAYVACAELLFGDARQADLVKIHKFSGKATFLSYEDFDSSLIPTLTTRSKVDLRAGRVDVFDHRGQGQMLFFKERFLSLDHPQRPLLLDLGDGLREVGISDKTFMGPSAFALRALLAERGSSALAEAIFASKEEQETP